MTVPQNMQALQLANEIRLFRSELRREVMSLDEMQGRALLADVITNGYMTDPRVHAALEGALVTKILTWIHRVGPDRAGRIVYTAGISEFRRVRDLTDRQRRLLAEVLKTRADALVDDEVAA